MALSIAGAGANPINAVRLPLSSRTHIAGYSTPLVLVSPSSRTVSATKKTIKHFGLLPLSIFSTIGDKLLHKLVRVPGSATIIAKRNSRAKFQVDSAEAPIALGLFCVEGVVQ